MSPGRMVGKGLVLVLCACTEALSVPDLASEVLRFVNERRETLGTDPKLFALVRERKERNLGFRATATKATMGRFGIGHRVALSELSLCPRV